MNEQPSNLRFWAKILPKNWTAWKRTPARWPRSASGRPSAWTSSHSSNKWKPRRPRRWPPSSMRPTGLFWFKVCFEFQVCIDFRWFNWTKLLVTDLFWFKVCFDLKFVLSFKFVLILDDLTEQNCNLQVCLIYIV